MVMSHATPSSFVEHFEHYAERYARDVAPSYADAHRYLIAHASHDKPARIVDIGCGNGVVLNALARRGVGTRRVGVDPAGALLRWAALAEADVEWRCAGAAELPFADGAFDLAFCCLVLPFVDDPSRASAEITRVLVPKGELVTVIIDEQRQTSATPEDPGWMAWLAQRDAAAHRALLDAGLILIAEAPASRATGSEPAGESKAGMRFTARHYLKP
jgi:ubiquinone/menaquinone biosynthesis C-methylase UbiE